MTTLHPSHRHPSTDANDWDEHTADMTWDPSWGPRPNTAEWHERHRAEEVRALRTPDEAAVLLTSAERRRLSDLLRGVCASGDLFWRRVLRKLDKAQ
jgi:hypothetical protein